MVWKNLSILWEAIKQPSECPWKLLRFQRLFDIWMEVKMAGWSQQRLLRVMLALPSTLEFWNLPGMCFFVFIFILGYLSRAGRKKSFAWEVRGQRYTLQLPLSCRLRNAPFLFSTTALKINFVLCFHLVGGGRKQLINTANEVPRTCFFAPISERQCLTMAKSRY